MTVPTIHIRNAHLAYTDKPVFTNLNLSLPAGKWVGLLGASGVGKSSLLRTIAGLNQTASLDLYADNAIPVTEQIAYMAQTDLLLPWLNVLSNAALGYKLRHQYSKAIAEQALALLARVNMRDTAHLYPRQLSGGMRQRVALVRTLMENKPVVLMDEPFSALDAITRYQLHELAVELLGGKTVLFITHDPLEALRLADEIYIMQPHPLQIKYIMSIDAMKPRKLSDPVIMHNQQVLYEQLRS